MKHQRGESFSASKSCISILPPISNVQNDQSYINKMIKIPIFVLNHVLRHGNCTPSLKEHSWMDHWNQHVSSVMATTDHLAWKLLPLSACISWAGTRPGPYNWNNCLRSWYDTHTCIHCIYTYKISENHEDILCMYTISVKIGRWYCNVMCPPQLKLVTLQLTTKSGRCYGLCQSELTHCRPLKPET